MKKEKGKRKEGGGRGINERIEGIFVEMVVQVGGMICLVSCIKCVICNILYVLVYENDYIIEFEIGV